LHLMLLSIPMEKLPLILLLGRGFKNWILGAQVIAFLNYDMKVCNGCIDANF